MRRPLAIAFLLLAFPAASSVASDFVKLKVAVPDVSGSAIEHGAQLLQKLSAELAGFAEVELVKQETDPLELLRNGTVDIAIVPSSALTAVGAKDLTSFDLPFLFTASDEVSVVQNSLVGQNILSSLHYQGLVGLSFWNAGMSQLIGSSFSELKDLKGKTVCVQKIDSLLVTNEKTFSSGSTSSVTAEAVLSGLGVNATISDAFVKETKDVRSNCSQGADAIEVAPTMIDQKEFKTPPSWLSSAGFRPIVFVLTMREDRWNKLTSRVQEALASEAIIAGDKVAAELDRQTGIAIEVLKTKGLLLLRNTTTLTSAGAKSVWKSVSGKEQQTIINQIIPIINQNRSVAISPEKHGKAETSQPDQSVSRELLFATDRKDDFDTPEYRFGNSFGPLVYGRRASQWMQIDIWVGGGPATKLSELEVFGVSDFRTRLNEMLSKAEKKEVLIYIHGYNNLFRNAAVSATLLDDDLKFGGITLLYSWPSNGALSLYPSDEDNVRASRDDFLDFIQKLSQIKAVKKMFIFAHSMGGRLPTFALDYMNAGPGKEWPKVQQIIMAAPDVDANLFSWNPGFS